MLRLNRRLPLAAIGLMFSTGLHATSVSSHPMLAVPGFAPIGKRSVSTIVRTEDSITVTVHTDLEPGAYSMWLLVWNHPEDCTAPGNCAPPPEGPDVPDSVVFATGVVVNSSGVAGRRGNLGTRLEVGETSRVIAGAVQAGLTNPLGAEVHAVIADHGDVLPDLINAQLSTPNAGCGGPCPVIQGVPHRPGVAGDIMLQLESIKELLDRVAKRNGLRP